jgi:hypothetical protein
MYVCATCATRVHFQRTYHDTHGARGMRSKCGLVAHVAQAVLGRKLKRDTMTAEHDKNPSGFRIETRWMNDHPIPRYFGSDITRDGFRSAPVPPADPQKEDWKILETHLHTACTRWYRVCRDYWGTTRLAAAGRVVARMIQIKKEG